MKRLEARVLLLSLVILFLLFAPPQFVSRTNDPDERVRWEDYWRIENRLKHGWKDAPMESVNMDGKRQLFIDNVVIEHMDSNLKRRLHQPLKHEGNPVLRADRPWDVSIAYVNVIYDDEEQEFKAWYQSPNGLGYATSRDGQRWEKPSLGLVEIDGSKDNNFVLRPPGMDSPTVVKDPFEKDLQKRYKYLAKHNEPTYGIYVGHSPDGIRWTIRNEPVLTSAQDSGLNDRPNLLIDLAKQRYLALTKREMINPYGQGDWGMLHRCKAVAVSSDFARFTDPVLTLHPDDQDPPDLQIYGLMGFNYENQYVGLMDIFHSGAIGPMERTVDVQLAVSRDGETWYRAGNREVFLPIGAEGSWDRFRVYPANTAPILRGEELWLYYRGTSDGRHGGDVPSHRRREPWFAPGHPEDEPLPPGTPGTGMGMAKLRRDGFVSLDAGPRPGRLLTRPLYFQGEDLHVNVDAREGRLRAELFLAERIDHRYPSWNWAINQPVAGYSLEDSVPVSGDTTNGILRWKGGNLKQFAGKPVVLRLELAQASLYSFWVE